LGLIADSPPVRAQDSTKTSSAMENDYFGEPNPDAPSQLSVFDFLIGRWSCEVTVIQEDGSETTLQATWTGRYILDGYVIADEYRMKDAKGGLVMLGENYRAYDTSKDTWNMKWLEALSGTWLDLAPERLGGVISDENAVEYKMEYNPGEIHRIRFSEITDDSFTWTVDISTDGEESWNRSVMTIRAARIK